ncbi:MAG: BlaI/MecI/CopY family transcriptional regulator [Bacteroidaceae bacterium]|nr:BlaI/MecI/CopY family transcriptional regulator [Bacteroidaceae bacterium]MBR1755169.1 BlaI/MecI/CopY family transcriptional regulator [Bacteroidaceae bacterium]
MIKLSQKEEEVMEHIWQLGECTPREALNRYPEPQPQLNGIQNVFQSLERKGYLAHRREGRGYVYWPIVEKKDYGRSRLSSFVDRYLDGSIKELVSFFAREQKLTSDDLRDIISLIEESE